MNLISRFFAAIGIGDGRPLTRRDRSLWAAARSLADLGELTALWLDGSIASQPGYYGPCDVDEDDAPGLTDTLILLNRAGYVTFGSQAGYDGAPWQQLAAVEGLAAPHTYNWLCDGDTVRVRPWATWWSDSDDNQVEVEIVAADPQYGPGAKLSLDDLGRLRDLLDEAEQDLEDHDVTEAYEGAEDDEIEAEPAEGAEA